MLIFLGAAPQIADELAQSNPPSSFVSIQQMGDQISCVWNGLIWTLNGNHLKERHIAPPKEFTLANTLQGLWNGRMWRADGVGFNISIALQGQGRGRFWVTDTGDESECANLSINDKAISFTVGADQNQMNFTGQATMACSNLAGTFTSHFGNGQWEGGWVNIGSASNELLMLVHNLDSLKRDHTFVGAALFA
jgi:hypothetical protein